MNRKALREFTHRAENFLSIGNTDYKQWVFRYTFLELEKDLGLYGDMSSNSVLSDSPIVEGRIVAKSRGVLAGLEEIKYFLVDAHKDFRPRVAGDFEVEFKFKDGDEVDSGEEIMIIRGQAKDVLAVERVVLNLLSRMSAVASFTKKVLSEVKDFDVLIAPTRKTLWGWLDKKAALLAGAGTHRLNLSDAIIVKDNHLELLGRDFELALANLVESQPECRFLEIEVENPDEALACAREMQKVLGGKIESVGVIMMDNMSIGEVGKALSLVKEAGLYDELLFEVSGGIRLENVRDYAETGVDIISMGQLTAGVDSFDFSLDISGGRGGT